MLSSCVGYVASLHVLYAGLLCSCVSFELFVEGLSPRMVYYYACLLAYTCFQFRVVPASLVVSILGFLWNLQLVTAC